eukprot:jgi/Psemu1/313008/fgenesh1_kg.1075_\
MKDFCFDQLSMIRVHTGIHGVEFPEDYHGPALWSRGHKPPALECIPVFMVSSSPRTTAAQHSGAGV